MSFISNIFLWLLPLVSIPLIIHLLNRRRIIQMDFSSIYFLESLKTNSMRRINILQWLLLAIRTIIILIIILMISRPVLKGYYPSMETSPSSSMSVIVIDDSFSLSGNINNESRLSLINEKYYNDSIYRECVCQFCKDCDKNISKTHEKSKKNCTTIVAFYF